MITSDRVFVVILPNILLVVHISLLVNKNLFAFSPYLTLKSYVPILCYPDANIASHDYVLLIFIFSQVINLNF